MTQKDRSGLHRVKMEGERQRYTIMAQNDRFAIMVKPFNPSRTYLYTISDLTRGVRGPCNLIFGPPCDVDTKEGAAEALAWIERGEMEVSYRHCVDLHPSEIAAILAARGPAATAAPSASTEPPAPTP